MDKKKNFEGTHALSIVNDILFLLLILVMIGAGVFCLIYFGYHEDYALLPMISLLIGAIVLFIFKTIIFGLTKITLASELYILETKRKMKQENL